MMTISGVEQVLNTLMNGEIGGGRLSDDELIANSMIGAARDPARFPEADRLDLSRSDNRALRGRLRNLALPVRFDAA